MRTACAVPLCHRALLRPIAASSLRHVEVAFQPCTPSAGESSGEGNPDVLRVAGTVSWVGAPLPRGSAPWPPGVLLASRT